MCYSCLILLLRLCYSGISIECPYSGGSGLGTCTLPIPGVWLHDVWSSACAAWDQVEAPGEPLQAPVWSLCEGLCPADSRLQPLRSQLRSPSLPALRLGSSSLCHSRQSACPVGGAACGFMPSLIPFSHESQSSLDSCLVSDNSCFISFIHIFSCY